MADAYREKTTLAERSTADLVRDIIGSVQEIIRSEVRLAAAETREKAVDAGKSAGLLAAGGIVALYAAAFALVFIYNVLSNLMWPWLSALILAVVLGVAALGMIERGRRKLKEVHPKPERTAQSVKEDVEWLKHQMR
ncbi:MAG: phage holin family protein [Bryobacterales bacterium]|nr:phage holin family protein [Bryobacterales bacterium]